MRIAYLDGPRLRRSLLAACHFARQQRSELNRINVFPVPDGDTGTNLALTLSAISDQLEHNQDRGVAAVAREAAQAAVMGARGNCGMMLSHFLLGFARSLEDAGRVEATGFATALEGGVDSLYGALERPVEGTILTVMRETADAARDSPTRDFEALFEHLIARARSSLSRTPDLLPVLRKAGVVDAGAKGFVSMLEGVLLFIHGDPIVSAPSEEDAPAAAATAELAGPGEQFRFCTEALVRGPELPAQDEARDRLREMGDSLIVIRAGDVLKVHVHTDEPDEVFAYLRSLGELVTHKAEDMRVQHEAVESAARRHVTLARRPLAIVTDSAADLPAEIVRAHGIQVVPLVLVTPEGVYRDGVDITAQEFHDLLRSGGSGTPTTSQPAPADFLKGFERAAEDGEEVLGVILGSALSGTFSSAEAAASLFTAAPVHLADSKGASLLQGLLALKAAELAELGWAPQAILAELARVRAQSGIVLTVDNFDRLLASGRVGRGRAMLGSLLSVKPILALDGGGRVYAAGKVLGAKRVVPAMVEEVAKHIPAGARKLRFGVVHVCAEHLVEPVTEAIRERFGRDVEVLVALATPVVATHVGPGGWALAYLVED